MGKVAGDTQIDEKEYDEPQPGAEGVSKGDDQEPPFTEAPPGSEPEAKLMKEQAEAT